MTARRWTPELVSQVAAWRADDVTWNAIGLRLDLSPRYVRKALARAGCNLAKERDGSIDERIIQLIETGATYREIAARLDIDSHRVAVRVAALGAVGPRSCVRGPASDRSSEIESRRIAGASVRNIAADFGISCQAVYAHLNRAARRRAVIEHLAEAA